jgi:hypothetical protein
MPTAITHILVAFVHLGVFLCSGACLAATCLCPVLPCATARPAGLTVAILQTLQCTAREDGCALRVLVSSTLQP